MVIKDAKGSRAIKAKGRDAEKAICLFLIENGFPHAERRRLSGEMDRGDIAGVYTASLGDVCIEVKNERRLQLSGWLKEAQEEGARASAGCYAVWHKKSGTANPGEWYVTMDGLTFLELLKATE